MNANSKRISSSFICDSLSQNDELSTINTKLDEEISFAKTKSINFSKSETLTSTACTQFTLITASTLTTTTSIVTNSSTNLISSLGSNCAPNLVENYCWPDLVLQFLEAAKSGHLEFIRRLIELSKQPHLCPDGAPNDDLDTNQINIAEVGLKKVNTLELINCRDIDGRHSTPLHFAAGYNRVGVVELLLEYGADVHAKDKGGLVPLHNACSYGHVKVRLYLN